MNDTERIDVIDQRFKEQDLRHETRLETFKNEICEDLEERFEKFRQEIKSGSEEAHITVGGETRDTPSERQLHSRQQPRQLQQQLNEQLQLPPPLYAPHPRIQTPSAREPVQEPRHLPSEVGSRIQHRPGAEIRGVNPAGESHLSIPWKANSPVFSRDPSDYLSLGRRLFYSQNMLGSVTYSPS